MFTQGQKKKQNIHKIRDVKYGSMKRATPQKGRKKKQKKNETTK